jgi:flagellar motor component MotA
MMIYVDIASLALVPGFAILLSLAFFSPREIGNAFRYAKESAPFDKTEIEKGIVYFSSLQNLIIFIAIFGCIIGVIAILQNISDMSIVGKNMGMALIVTLYAMFFICFLTIPFTGALKKRLAAHNE